MEASIFSLICVILTLVPIDGNSNPKNLVEIMKDPKGHALMSANVPDYSYPECRTTRKKRKPSRDINDITWTRQSSAFPTQTDQTIIQRQRRQSGNSKGKSLYFSRIGEVLILKNNIPQQYKNTVIPRENFTVEIWLKPEGGQTSNVNIISLQDVCKPNSSYVWSMGISTAKGQGHEQKSDARFHFHLSTDRTDDVTKVTDRQKYRLGRWSHLAATYDGARMTLFVNGAKMASSDGQRGALFAESLAECKSLQIGGDPKRETFYRGALNKLQIWSEVLSHGDIVKSMLGTMNNTNGLFIGSHLERRHDVWKRVGTKTPGHVTMDQNDYDHDFKFSVPPCGETICDDPDIVMSYVYRWQLKQKKTLKYRVLNVMNDDGSEPTVSEAQLDLQDEALRLAYKRYNISWQMEAVEIRNTSLRAKTVLHGCDPGKVADGLCQAECNHTATGYDGGDCYGVRGMCEEHQLGNGVCDVGCNKYFYSWDAGDCCQHDDVKNCLDPTSPKRRYLFIEEYKQMLGHTNRDALNIYFAEWTQPYTIGIATFPWDPETHSSQGGVVVRADTFGSVNKSLNVVHELGHVLGLWHVHLGVSEMDCGDPCRETEASLHLGDLCDDTEPTPIHRHCGDPDALSMADRFLDLLGGTCGVKEYQNTPYKNYMSYTGNGCADHFSKQQVARMHCYIDLVHGPWVEARGPSPVPLSPQIVTTDAGSVTMTWLPPVGSGSTSISDVCSQCKEDYSLVQYANQSTTAVALGFGSFGPTETVGPPDADTCGQSAFTLYSWVPHGPDGPCYGEQCWIELSLKYPVVVRRLSIWFPYVEEGVIQSIDLIYVDDTKSTLEPVSVYCDMPYTVELLAEKRQVYKVIIRGNSSAFAVDALAVQSEENSAVCKKCPILKYHVTRQPPFKNEDGTTKASITTKDMLFSDNTLAENVTYTYTIQASLETYKQLTESPELMYYVGMSFCGDGNVDIGEQCDDGNRRNYDGCTLICHVEEYFKCNGNPSLCYRYFGDGICESFEWTNSLADCGHVTPVGFKDYWAMSVIAGPGQPDPMFMGLCSPEVVIGPPHLHGPEFHQKPDPTISWRPDCLLSSITASSASYFLQMEISQPIITSTVLLYVATDKTSLGSREYLSVSINASLIDITGHLTLVETESINVTNTVSAIMINIRHDLSMPLKQSIGVRLHYNSAHLDIYAVALRAADWLQPVMHAKCDGHSYYDNIRHTCVSADMVCDVISCGRPAIKHADVVCAGIDEGHYCSVKCKTGYEEQETGNTIKCVNGTWTGDVRCTPVTCGVPKIPYASVDCPDGTTLNQKCKFDCLPPARKQGRSHVLVCQTDGLWSLPEGYCRVLCPPLVKVKNATLTSSTCADGTQDLGTTCGLKCDKGFRVKNQVELERKYELMCTSNGEWAGPQCEKIKCVRLPMVYSGVYSCTDGFKAGSSCTIKCPGADGVTSNVNCQKSGVWNKAPDECHVGDLQCPDMSRLARSGIVSDCVNRTVGFECNLRCEYPNYDLVDVSAKELMVTSRSSKAVLCTYSGHWLPSVDNLQCLPKCEKYFVGDGYCDPNNNQARCQWDGGDCCLSTSLSGFVTSCGPACSCKDPDATENRDIVNRVRRHQKRRRRAKRTKRKHGNRRRLLH